ncbi:MAG: hypothetical protein K2X94_03260 [Amoebophilaceae bacterium]|nr:hypothetical protein [Amoebophilaceae bacterium]
MVDLKKYSFLHLLFLLFSLLPLRLLYILSDLLLILIYYLIGYRKQIVSKNLTNAFPHATLQARKNIEKQCYKQLCDLLIEHIKALTITKKKLLQQVKMNNLALLKAFYKQQKSILLISGHFGNWEWTAHAIALQTNYTLCAGYQPLHAKPIDKIATYLRTRFKRKCMPYFALYRYIMTHTATPQAIALLIDQAPFHKKKVIGLLF